MLESVRLIDDLDLDRPVYGARDIGAIVNLTERQAHHALDKGYLDADKFGRKWRSTKRRLLKTPTPQTHPSSKEAHQASPCDSPSPPEPAAERSVASS
jgi:hypothetical protein